MITLVILLIALFAILMPTMFIVAAFIASARAGERAERESRDGST